MLKPRIIILMHYLELGGAEMALIGLLQALSPDMVDVDLFIYSHRGPLMKFIPGWVNLLPEKAAYAVIEEPMTTALRRGHIGVVAGRLLAKWKYRQFRRLQPAIGVDAAIHQYIGDCLTPFLPRINPDVEYDLCISFLAPHNFAYRKVRAKKRIAWIHTDYSIVDINTAQELPVWDAFDWIISISPQVTASFIGRFPSLSPKILSVENILSADFVRKRALEFDSSDDLSQGIRLLSVGRLCEAKNYDNVPDIARRIIASGIKDLKWHIIGYGGNEGLIRQKIAEAGMEKHVILLGKKDNPYPYVKACDIYVQPSRYEGKSITVREAQILCKPVAVTAYPTAASQIRHGVDGVIVPLDNEGCAQGLADFIVDTALQRRIIDYLRTHDYANTSEVEKIYELLK